jgi:hypothetical protein
LFERNRLRGEVMDSIGATVTARIDSSLEPGSVTCRRKPVLPAQTLLSRTKVLLPAALCFA